MGIESDKRLRRRAPKVRTGCITCKTRRIKCDEGKPACRRCIDSRYNCQGYNVPKPWLFVTSQAPRLEAQLIPRYGDGNDARYLDFFLHRTVPNICKYASPFFWNVLAPQMSWHHSAIRHALVALSMNAEVCDRVGPSHTCTPASLHHYNKAIKALVSEPPPSDVILTSCMLFWMYDNIGGRSEVALTHLRAAVGLLNDENMNRPRNPAQELIKEHIEPAFQEGMAYTSIIIRKPQVPVTSKKFVENEISIQQVDFRLVENFANLDEAVYSLSVIINSLTITTNQLNTFNISGDDPSWPENMRMVLYKWSEAFQRFPGPAKENQRRIVHAHYVAASLLLESMRAPQDFGSLAEMKHTQRFKYILAQVKLALQDRMMTGDDDFGMALIPLMCFTARHCTDEGVRRDAISLLNQCHCIEGIWNSAVAAETMKLLTDTNVGKTERRYQIDSLARINMKSENHEIQEVL